MATDPHFPEPDPALPEEHKPTDMPAARTLGIVIVALLVVSAIILLIIYNNTDDQQPPPTPAAQPERSY